jgi:hypothetical protein
MPSAGPRPGCRAAGAFRRAGGFYGPEVRAVSVAASRRRCRRCWCLNRARGSRRVLAPITAPELRLLLRWWAPRTRGSAAALVAVHRARTSTAAPWCAPPARAPRPGCHRAADARRWPEVRAAPWWAAPRPRFAPCPGAVAAADGGSVAPEAQLPLRWCPPLRPGGHHRPEDRAAPCPPRPSFGCRCSGAIPGPEVRAAPWCRCRAAGALHRARGLAAAPLVAFHRARGSRRWRASNGARFAPRPGATAAPWWRPPRCCCPRPARGLRRWRTPPRPGGVHRPEFRLLRPGEPRRPRCRCRCAGGFYAPEARAASAAVPWRPPPARGSRRPLVPLPRPGALHRAQASAAVLWCRCRRCWCLNRAQGSRRVCCRDPVPLPRCGWLYRARASRRALTLWWRSPARASATGALVAPSTAPELRAPCLLPRLKFAPRPGAVAASLAPSTVTAPKVRLPSPGGPARASAAAPLRRCRALVASTAPEVRAAPWCRCRALAPSTAPLMRSTGPRLGCRALAPSTVPELRLPHRWRSPRARAPPPRAFHRAADVRRWPEARLPRCWRPPRARGSAAAPWWLPPRR